MLGLLKSPMGLMIGFMVICVFLLPMLMDSIGELNLPLAT
jgi:amino acid permease